MTATLFYVDQDGNYLGAFAPLVRNDEVVYTHQAPNNSVAVPSAPDHAAQKWDFEDETWLPLEQPLEE